MATYGDLKSRIKNEIARTTDPDIDAAVVNAVADAITYYSSYPFWFLETSQDIANVAGTAGYSLPSDYRTMVSVAQGNTTAGTDLLTLDAMHIDRYRDLVPTESLRTGRPSFYALFGSTIFLYPTPNDAYYTRIWYRRVIETLSSDDSSNSWTNEAEPLIRTHAKIDLFVNYIRDASGDEIDRLSAQEGMWLAQLQRRSAAFQTTGQVVSSSW